jgi:hypothetical protein
MKRKDKKEGGGKIAKTNRQTKTGKGQKKLSCQQTQTKMQKNNYY